MAQSYIIFIIVLVISQSVCPTQSSLIFSSKTAAYPSEASIRWPILRQAPGFTQKHTTRDKQSSSLQTFVNYVRKKFYRSGPWVVTKRELKGLFTLPQLSAIANITRPRLVLDLRLSFIKSFNYFIDLDIHFNVLLSKWH